MELGPCEGVLMRLQLDLVERASLSIPREIPLCRSLHCLPGFTFSYFLIAFLGVCFIFPYITW